MRFEREFYEKRIGLLIGALEKLGVLPGLLATALLVGKLGEDSPGWVRAIAYTTPIMYLLGIAAHDYAMRLERLSRILELALDRKKAREDCALNRNQKPSQS